uniref:ribosomal protein L22 n=1 Tax=Chroodactylon ornatum TaxID=139907 RepID=UPI001FCD73D4|nr:ribosomal protein L22 [Chroodactylon ornatum]UNJ14567.1 ribosomal protein L22 [Chroodactylon ornatum]
MTTKIVSKAVGRYIRTSPSKVRRVLDQIRNKDYFESILILTFMPYKSSRIILEILKSAAANAENNSGLSKKDLIISKAYADKGPILKRFRPRAQGRGYRIKKATSHIFIEVSEKN